MAAPRARVRTVGGRTRVVPHIKGMPPLAEMPRAHKVTDRVNSFPSLQERHQQTVGEISQDDRYRAFFASVGGSIYDFMIHDYLLYQRHLTRSDFSWLTTVHGFAVDYYFPGRQRIWNVRSRTGIPFLTFGRYAVPGVEGLRDAAMRSAGLNVTTLHIENLAQDRNQGTTRTLDAAWLGKQLP